MLPPIRIRNGQRLTSNFLHFGKNTRSGTSSKTLNFRSVSLVELRSKDHLFFVFCLINISLISEIEGTVRVRAHIFRVLTRSRISVESQRQLEIEQIKNAKYDPQKVVNYKHSYFLVYATSQHRSDRPPLQASQSQSKRSWQPKSPPSRKGRRKSLFCLDFLRPSFNPEPSITVYHLQS
jgi:hypothetical protein